MMKRSQNHQPPSPETQPLTRPRVLVVGAHLTKTLGGISTLLADLLSSPLANEFEFYHIASQADEYGRLGKIRLALAALLSFFIALVRWRPQLVYVHIGGNASLYRKVPFLVLARLMRKRVLAHFHAGDFEFYFARQNWLGRQLILCGLRQPHRLIAVSQYLGELLGRLLSEAPIVVVPNGIKTSLFARDAAAHHDPGAQSDSAGRVLHLLFIGAMGRLKGERDLIAALGRVLSVAPQFRLSMLGHGAQPILQLCQQAGLLPFIEHLGPVPLEQRTAFFKRASIFVLPTYAEGLPVAVLEAMAAGLPVIATRVGGIPELIEDGVEGYLIEPGDIDALSQRIIQLINHPEQRQSMGARAQARAQQFDWEKILEQLGAQLRQAINQQVSWSSKETVPPIERRSAARGIVRMSPGQTSRLGKRALKSSAAPLCRWLRAGQRRFAVRRDGEKGVLILGYHRIVADIEQAEREAIFGLVTSVETFRRHLEIIRKRYQVLTLDEAIRVLRGERSVNSPAAVITFDDGYRDVYEQALPVLRNMGLPATVFVPTAFIGTSQLLDHDRLYWLILKARATGASLHLPLEQAGLRPAQVEALCLESDPVRLSDRLLYLPFEVRQRLLSNLEATLCDGVQDYPAGYELMNWEMIAELVRAGFTIGAHSDRHPVLTLESVETIKREITSSKRILEERLKEPVRHFAYPNGQYNEEIRQMIAQAGFEAAVTTENRLNYGGANLLSLGRVCLSEESTRGVRGSYSEAVARLRLAA